jgi:NAD(P)-dependent dehydrogenase (short-subunit alcohol dehydrogenase family)
MTEEFPRPTRSLAGRVAIVSGAGAAGDGIGNGRASAILLAEAGADVVCVDMKHDLAQRTAELIEEEGHGKAIAVQADVTSEEDAKNVISKTLEAFGRIDILVNVVGIGGAAGTAEEVDMVEWAKGMEVNVASMVIMAKYCIPYMAKNEGQWRGSIVNMASVAGIRGGTPHLLYPTSKGAIVVSCVPGTSVSLDWLTGQGRT